MNATPFPEANCTLGPPAGMTADECRSLPVFIDGTGVISRWQPTAGERAAIAAGAPVWLVVWGKGMPPVSLSTRVPFERKGE